MVPALMTSTGNRPTWDAVDARLAKVIATTGPDGRLGWVLPITGGTIRAGEVVALWALTLFPRALAQVIPQVVVLMSVVDFSGLGWALSIQGSCVVGSWGRS
jgi:hypothetical protein